MTRVHVVVTRREAMRILGIRNGALLSLEKTAKVRHDPERYGYTDKELKLLAGALKEILHRKQ